MNKDMELFLKLARLERLMQREQGRLHREGRPFADTSRGQGRILAMLKIKDGISTKELSYLLGIRVSSLNEMLAKMERNGYISRKPSDEDKRISIIYLTEKGKGEMFEQMEETTVFGCFSDEEKVIFGGYLDRLIAELEVRNASEEHGEPNKERWMEMMRNHMGEEWFEHVMEIRGAGSNFGRQNEARRQRGDFRGRMKRKE